MRTIKNLLPIIILLALSSYIYQIYPRLTQTILNGIVFLPVTLTFMVVILSIQSSDLLSLLVVGIVVTCRECKCANHDSTLYFQSKTFAS